MMRCYGEGTRKGRTRVEMVLGPFAETKGPRRAGAKPRKTKIDHVNKFEPWQCKLSGLELFLKLF